MRQVLNLILKQILNELHKVIALAGCKIVQNIKEKIMFGNTKTETRGRKSLSKKQTILNALLRGQSIAWKTLNTKFGLKSPRSMVDTLRAEGYMVYGSKVKGKHVYRLGTPTRAIISAGIKALYGTPFKYDNASVVAPTKATVASIDA